MKMILNNLQYITIQRESILGVFAFWKKVLSLGTGKSKRRKAKRLSVTNATGLLLAYFVVTFTKYQFVLVFSKRSV